MSIFIYVYICIYIHIYIRIHTYIYTCIHMRSYVFSYVCTYTSIYLSVHESIRIRMSHMWIRTQIHKLSSVSFKTSSLKKLARTVIQLLTHMFKNHSVTDWKSRRRMLQIGLLLSEIPWICLTCRDLQCPFKFVIRAVWNKKRLVRDAKQKGSQCEFVQMWYGAIVRFELCTFGPRTRRPPSCAT